MRALSESLPSPEHSVWYLGPVPLRAYALCILAGVVVAVVIGNRRWLARGGRTGEVVDVAVWAIPFGLVGGRLYHVITTWEQYLHDPAQALRVWEGGLGIWGAIALGAVGAAIGCRRHGIRLPPLGDAIAPGIAVGQAIGRWGNWFNQELYGRPSDLPWAVEIDPEHRPPETPHEDTYHPTFLYESIWCLLVAWIVVRLDRRYQMGHGRVFALYLALYCLGRGVIETFRVDPAHHVGGLRLNVWTSIVVGLGAGTYLWLTRGKGREATDAVHRDRSGREAAPVDAAD
jgi:prolipoprotein diacylglyceryl transferase